jgi:4'-phosphopantetheinyl transferase
MTDTQFPLDGARQVHLWLAHPAQVNDEALLKRYEALLGEQELSSYTQLVSSDHRREYLISQAFLRDVLSYYSQWEPARFEFVRNPSGKPGLLHAEGELANLHFNLSHSVDLMACVVSRAGKVGVDVEPLQVDNPMVGMAEQYFSQREVDSLQGLDAAEQSLRFSQIWTLKEAFIKARGEGLSQPLDSFSFEFLPDASIELHENGSDGAQDGWRFWSLHPLSGHVTAIAVEARDAELRVFSGVPLREMSELALNDLGLVA